MLKIVISILVFVGLTNYIRRKRKWNKSKDEFLAGLTLTELLIESATSHRHLDEVEKSVNELILINKKYKFI